MKAFMIRGNCIRTYIIENSPGIRFINKVDNNISYFTISVCMHEFVKDQPATSLRDGVCALDKRV